MLGDLNITSIIESIIVGVSVALTIIVKLSSKIKEVTSNLEKVKTRIEPTNGSSETKSILDQLETIDNKLSSFRTDLYDASLTNEAWRRAVLDTENIAMFEADSAGLCTWISNTFRILTGIDSLEARGSGWLSIVHPDDREDVRREWLLAIKEQRDFDLHFRMRNCISGKIITVHVRTANVRISNNRHLGTFSRIFVIETINES